MLDVSYVQETWHSITKDTHLCPVLWPIESWFITQPAVSVRKVICRIRKLCTISIPRFHGWSDVRVSIQFFFYDDLLRRLWWCHFSLDIVEETTVHGKTCPSTWTHDSKPISLSREAANTNCIVTTYYYKCTYYKSSLDFICDQVTEIRTKV
jgi:hypothetical protein